MANVLILIPARYQSSRFPGKPLAKIHNKSMIQMVYENCVSTGSDVAVVTDDARISENVSSFGGHVQVIEDQVSTGTDRIYLAWERYYKDQKYDLVVNVQGDEPMLKGDELKKLIDFHLQSKFDITTIVKEKYDLTEFNNPNNVKAIYCPKDGRCLYFSRSAVPFFRDQKSNQVWFHHVGVYSYKTEALVNFCKATVGHYEDIEKLEQLRALEQGLTIGAIKTNCNLLGVDTPEDLDKLKEVLSE